MQPSVDDEEEFDTILQSLGLDAEQRRSVRLLAEQSPQVWAFLFTCARLRRLDALFDVIDPSAAEDHLRYANRAYHLLRTYILDGLHRAELIDQKNEAARILPEQFVRILDGQWGRDEFYRFLSEIDILSRQSPVSHLTSAVEPFLLSEDIVIQRLRQSRSPVPNPNGPSSRDFEEQRVFERRLVTITPLPAETDEVLAAAPPPESIVAPIEPCSAESSPGSQPMPETADSDLEPDLSDSLALEASRSRGGRPSHPPGFHEGKIKDIKKWLADYYWEHGKTPPQDEFFKKCRILSKSTWWRWSRDGHLRQTYTQICDEVKTHVESKPRGARTVSLG